MTPDPLQLAQRTAQGRIDADVQSWLSDAFARWLAGENLPDAFNLDTCRRLGARNRALRAAADELDEGGTTWARAGLLVLAVKRFEARILPQLRRDPHYRLGPVDSHLQRAFAAGHRIPRTQRGLFDVLA